MGKEALQWHPAFCSSLQIELSGEPLQFLNEFNYEENHGDKTG